jgi:hypothetical protein
LVQIAYLDTLTASLPETMAGQEPDTLRRLIAKTQELERSVFLLRHQKAAMPADAYKQQMETLLIDLARTTRTLRLLRNKD